MKGCENRMKPAVFTVTQPASVCVVRVACAATWPWVDHLRPAVALTRTCNRCVCFVRMYGVLSVARVQLLDPEWITCARCVRHVRRYGVLSVELVDKLREGLEMYVEALEQMSVMQVRSAGPACCPLVTS